MVQFYVTYHSKICKRQHLGDGSKRTVCSSFHSFLVICFQQDTTLQFIYFWKTALHISGGISTHHQEHTQLYLQYLLLVKPLLLPSAIVEELKLV